MLLFRHPLLPKDSEQVLERLPERLGLGQFWQRRIQVQLARSDKCVVRRRHLRDTITISVVCIRIRIRGRFIETDEFFGRVLANEWNGFYRSGTGTGRRDERGLGMNLRPFWRKERMCVIYGPDSEWVRGILVVWRGQLASRVERRPMSHRRHRLRVFRRHLRHGGTQGKQKQEHGWIWRLGVQPVSN